jgi:hypothetical protein
MGDFPQVLTTNAKILCPHGNLGISTSGDPTWSVNGGMVLVEGDHGSFPPCPSQVQCGGYTLKSMGLNATQIKGKKVILVTDFNQTDSGLPITMSELHKVIDKTSPAPIPSGQDAPPLPPPLADETEPLIDVAPSGPFTFTISSNTPATVEVTFKLTSAHPLKWILTLVHEQPGTSSEQLNDSQPAGLTLTPSDSSWNASPLSITLKMIAAYMNTLAPGDHIFFMTAVSQRGLPSFRKLVLTVIP